MSLTKSVIDILNDEACLVNQLYHVFRMIHLTVTICHSSKIQACHRQAECCWFKALSVPQCLHDKEARILRHGCLGTGKNAYCLFFRETIQELTHPYRIQTPRSSSSTEPTPRRNWISRGYINCMWATKKKHRSFRCFFFGTIVA